MLIITERHTKEDLELWKDYEEVDLIYYKTNNMKLKEERSINAIFNFLKNGDAYIGVSWGKDSVTVADLAIRNGINLSIVHLYCVPSHNKECDLVRDEFLKKYSDIDYYEFICDYGDIYSKNYPDHIQDKLTDKIWYATWKTVEEKISKRHISGVRAKESGVRKLRMMRWGENTKKTCAPIGWWSTQDVFSYLAKYDLPIHSNYAMLGNGRYDRNFIRVAEIGDIHGNEYSRNLWEREYYGDILNKLRRG